MELKDLVGEGYKEGMTIEEVAAAIKDKMFVDPSTLPPSVSKETFDKTAAKLAALEKEKKSRMSEEERNQAKQQEVLDRMAALEKENAQMKHEKSFLAAGYDPDTAGKLAGHISEGDLEAFVRVQSDWAQKLKTSLYAQAKEELLKNTPSVRAGQETSGGQPDVDLAVNLAVNLAKARAASTVFQEEILKKFM